MSSEKTKESAPKTDERPTETPPASTLSSFPSRSRLKGPSTPPNTSPAPSIAPPRSKVNASSSGEQTEMPGEPVRKPSSNISPKDVSKWMKTGSFGNARRESIQEEDEEDCNGDEKEDNGNLMNGHEPCFNCGGKVVWAAAGNFSLICQNCQKPQ
ncbi:hypothetical protein BU26DRAFT_275728 [Trematosphaeria pertusa]|uniref:Uncharacterized protein n=1 Tax=Trematosphaeria pertusa TaxID=390896 RepID=A0A6A6IKW2_9PLEO|nr:uncharacterized protein BU26DRAFT_275728 [Trematosphaeria pertusa]KAF2251061.1 hypothetical protein BU26DRAFT_275728 [Trematosphaeria pertusa]